MNLTKFKNKTMIMVVLVIALSITTVGFSYAFLFNIDEINELGSTVSEGNLSVKFSVKDSPTTENKNITLNGLKPLTDEEGLSSESVRLIDIENNTNNDTTFKLTIGYDTLATGYSIGDELIPLEYIRIAIFSIDTYDQSAKQLTDVINLEDVMVNKIDVNNHLNNTYELLIDDIEKVGTGNSSKYYSIKIWLDENTPNSIINNELHLKIDLDLENTNDVYEYNMTTTILNSLNEPIQAGELKLENGIIKTNFNTIDGTVNLENIKLGSTILNLNNNGNEYSSIVKFVAGNNTSVTYGNSNIVISKNMSLSEIAYTTGTTIKRIKELNNFNENTNNMIYSEGTNVLLPVVNTISLINNSNTEVVMIIDENNMLVIKEVAYE